MKWPWGMIMEKSTLTETESSELSTSNCVVGYWNDSFAEGFNFEYTCTDSFEHENRLLAYVKHKIGQSIIVFNRFTWHNITNSILWSYCIIYPRILVDLMLAQLTSLFGRNAKSSNFDKINVFKSAFFLWIHGKFTKSSIPMWNCSGQQNNKNLRFFN